MTSRHPDTCAIVIDNKNQQIIEVRKTVLVNQITRDADRIGRSFDAIHGDDLNKISEQFALCVALLTSGLIKADQEEDELRIACCELLSNALNSLAAATHLVRSGFILQPGIILRSCIESLAVVLHLVQNRSDFESYRNHTFDSTRAITSAKRVFEPFGRIYGMLSKEFTHIGKMHKQVTPIREYSQHDEALTANLQFVAAGVWMCYATCELTFIDTMAKPRYWCEVPTDVPGHSAFSYNPSPSERAWMERFLSIGSAP
ncbi:hypothetical protein [Lysobacter niastensis]|uniref:Uncharacterized protein n=1 Tax=Lysobacter niastensis TaxID=380629 RepID=A0ABS0B707_9GAMM|nr:hypothetical protein [Lysobacter niastensis]MBF6022799.1 hypothetical protein [Lysobacter niastensis]